MVSICQIFDLYRDLVQDQDQDQHHHLLAVEVQKVAPLDKSESLANVENHTPDNTNQQPSSGLIIHLIPTYC